MLPPVHGLRACWLALLLGVSSAVAQTPAPSAPASTAAPLSGPQVIQMLDQTIEWYRTLGIEQQASNQPSDLFILYDNRQTASRIVGLAFDIARADTELLAKLPPGPASGSRSAVAQPILTLETRFHKQLADVQARLGEAQRQLAEPNGSPPADLPAKVSELQGEMDLFAARQSLVTTMLSIVDESDASGFSPDSLRSQIDAMAVTVNSSSNALGAPATGATATPPAAGNPAAPVPLEGSVNLAARFGIWDLAANVFRLSEKLSTIDGLDRHALTLTAFFAHIREPLTERLLVLSQQGDTLAGAAGHADAASLRLTRQALDTLGEQFKTQSSLMIPLGKVGVLLTQYRHNLANWHSLVSDQYQDALRTLGVRVLGLLLVLALVFIGAALWRRAVLRYVQEPRRRAQLFLVQRIVVTVLVVLIIGIAVISELTAVFTFAGLITAGLAVAMQSVLVSFVGYFFIVGKHGMRVGDRVQIGDVVGEVIELGLVRLHLMELGAKGLSGPTGRVVSFPNSVVFQVAAGVFKQIAGVNLAWHELTLALPEGLDYAATKARLLATVDAALKDAQPEITRQAQEIQLATASEAGADAEPRVQLAFSPAGVEARVRYPVRLSEAAELDERVSRELLATLRQLEAAKPP